MSATDGDLNKESRRCSPLRLFGIKITAQREQKKKKERKKGEWRETKRKVRQKNETPWPVAPASPWNTLDAELVCVNETRLVVCQVRCSRSGSVDRV